MVRVEGGRGIEVCVKGGGVEDGQGARAMLLVAVGGG